MGCTSPSRSSQTGERSCVCGSVRFAMKCDVVRLRVGCVRNYFPPRPVCAVRAVEAMKAFSAFADVKWLVRLANSKKRLLPLRWAGGSRWAVNFALRPQSACPCDLWWKPIIVLKLNEMCASNRFFWFRRCVQWREAGVTGIRRCFHYGTY